MTTEQKFEAAVNVIRSLPKNGSYQPSNELMLRFYGYYKQATEGPCKGARPAFWDVVGRAKYDAWKKLGNLPKSEAMARYVDELHSIVETMSYSDNVANFLEAPTKELQTINMDDLELIAGDILKKVNSQPNSPLASRDASPIHNSRPESIDSTAMLADDESDEEYIDTIEAPEPKKFMNDPMYFEPTINGILQKEHSSRTRTRIHNIDISAEISKAVQNIQVDIEQLRHKIQLLERDKTIATKTSTFFDNFSPTFMAFLIVWPFLCNFLMQRYLKNK